MNRLFFAVCVVVLCPVRAWTEAEEVANIRKEFETRHLVEVDRPHEKGETLWRAKYLQALDQELKKATEAGKSITAIELRLEIQSFGFEGTKPSPNPATPELIGLRKSYEEGLERLKAQRQANLVSLVAKFAPEIKKIEIELTKARRIDDALEARALQNQLQDLAEGKIAAIMPPEKPKPQPGPNPEAPEYLLEILAQSERRDFTGPPREPVPKDVFYIESDESNGTLHLTFSDERLGQLNPREHLAWLRIRTAAHRLAPTGGIVTVHLGKAQIGRHYGAPTDHDFSVPLDLAAFPNSGEMELRVECGKDAVIVKTAGSDQPPRLVIDRAGGTIIEGEDMRIAAVSNGDASSQPTGTFRNRKGDWSGQNQMWWRKSEPGDQLALEFEAPKAATYDFRFSFGYARDYGTFRILLDSGPELFSSLNLLSREVLNPGEIPAGRRRLEAGKHRLLIETLEPDPQSTPKLNGFGLDYLRLIEAEGAGNN